MEYIYTMNQGICFSRGYVYALTVLSERYPRYKKRLDAAELLLEEMISNMFAKDGSYHEGASYWAMTVGDYFTSAHLLARRRGTDIKGYVGETFAKTAEFGLFMLDPKGLTLPVNDSGVKYYQGTVPNIMAQITENPRWEALAGRTAASQVVPDEFQFLLTAKTVRAGGEFKPLEFTVFHDVGMTALYRDHIYFFGVSGPSNTVHCHHDKGSFLVYKDGKPLIADFGYGAHNMISRTHMAEWHNLCIPLGGNAAFDQIDRRFHSSDAGATLIKSEYSDGRFEWVSDNTLAWDKKLVKKSVRTIVSEKPNIFIVTDEFEFTEAVPVSFRLNLYDTEAVRVRPLDWTPAVRDIAEVLDFYGKPVYQLRLDTSAQDTVKMTTEVVIL
jgi:hypothetical protein